PATVLRRSSPGIPPIPASPLCVSCALATPEETVWDQGARSGGDGATVRTAPRRVNAVSLVRLTCQAGDAGPGGLRRRTPAHCPPLHFLVVVGEVYADEAEAQIRPKHVAELGAVPAAAHATIADARREIRLDADSRRG